MFVESDFDSYYVEKVKIVEEIQEKVVKEKQEIPHEKVIKYKEPPEVAEEVEKFQEEEAEKEIEDDTESVLI